MEDLFSNLSSGTTFTKLDLSQAYQQLELDEQSKQYTVINTHRGLFRYNRLPFGISLAPGIFQRAIESLLSGIPKVINYLDDILYSYRYYRGGSLPQLTAGTAETGNSKLTFKEGEV